MGETAADRLRRLRMRSWRRGIRETDLILGPFADAALARLGAAELDAFEALLAEPDPELYRWLSGREPAPARHAELVALIRAERGIA